MGTEEQKGWMKFADWLADKPVDWQMFRLEEMHYEMWEDLYLETNKEDE